MRKSCAKEPSTKRICVEYFNFLETTEVSIFASSDLSECKRKFSKAPRCFNTLLCGNYFNFHKITRKFQALTFREWDFRTEQNLIEELNEDESKIFPTDVFNFDKDEYSKNCMLGVRQFIVKEPLSSLPKSRTQVKM
jgi:Male sterility protein